MGPRFRKLPPKDFAPGSNKRRLGRGLIIHGDAMAIMTDMDDESVDLIVTDPPYKVISGGNKSKHKSGYKTSVLHANDGKIFRHNAAKMADYLRHFFRILKPGTHCYVMTNVLNLTELLNTAKATGFRLHNLLVWDKVSCNANRWYMSDSEFAVFLYKPPAKRINNAGSKRIKSIPNPRNKVHPTEKPVELMRYYIENSSKPGDLVLDPFAGSGSTAVAAQLSGRRWITIELDPKFANVALHRLREAAKT